MLAQLVHCLGTPGSTTTHRSLLQAEEIDLYTGRHLRNLTWALTHLPLIARSFTSSGLEKSSTET